MDSFYKPEELKDLGFKHVGKGVLLSRKAVIYDAGNIEIGDYTRIDDFCILSGNISLGSFIHIGVCTRLSGSRAQLTMKDFSGISYNCTVIASSEDYSGEFMTNPMVPLKYKKILPNPVVLEKHALIATHSVVLPGVTVGEGTALGAMSLLLKDAEPWSIYVGAPAKRIRDRKRNLLKLENQMMDDIKSGRTILGG